MDSPHPLQIVVWIFFGIVALSMLFGFVQFLLMRERNRERMQRSVPKKGGPKPAPTSAASATTWGISGMSASDMQVGVGGTSTMSDLSPGSDSGGSFEIGDTGGGGDSGSDSGGGDFSGGGGDGGGGGSSGGWND